MKISWNWLQDYIELPANISLEEVTKRLTFAGFEVESVKKLGTGLEKVFVGQILERKQHPNADRLSLCIVDVGMALTEKGEKLEIVCGAQNIKAGQKVPVATLGAILPNGMEIKAAKIRGVASCGMLCSLEELQFPKEWQSEDGIFLQKDNAIIGMPLAKHLGLDDTILELNVTPNRGDCLSHFGIARELAAIFGLQLKLTEPKVQIEASGKVKLSITNKVGKELCSAYHTRFVEGVKIGASPDWLRRKLEAIGLRSINNVVDVTSYVMFEMGQPLHAFDADTLENKKEIGIVIRSAQKEETFVSLSDKSLSLVPQDLVIAAGENGNKAAALAGVMGGKDTEVTDKTQNILIEAAEFHPVFVRKTGRRLALLTDAAYRFERGVDSGKILWALDRATKLIQELAGGKAGGIVSDSEQNVQDALPSIRLRHTEIQRLLGKAPDLSQVVNILRTLGFTAEIGAGEPNLVNVLVPKWRKDVKRSVDLIEEIARIWGFEHLEAKLPLGGIGQAEPQASKRRPYFQVRRVRRHLSSLGFFEVLNHGFTSRENLAKILTKEELQNLVEIANPVSQDYSVMKPTLLSGLLENIAHNLSHKRRNMRIFEARRTFALNSTETTQDPRLSTGVRETTRLAFAITGQEVDEFWQGKESSVDFYSMKGSLDSVFEILAAGGVQYQANADKSYLHPGQSARIALAGNRILGVAGRLHPRVEKNYGFDQAVYVAELDLDLLLGAGGKIVRFHPYSNFPVVERDFSALVKQEVNSQMIRALVTKIAQPLIKEFFYFDVYTGARVPAGHVSYAFRVLLGAEDHTLADQEINSVQEKIMRGLEKEFGAKFAGLS